MNKNLFQKITGFFALAGVLYVAGVFQVVATQVVQFSGVFMEEPTQGYACTSYGYYYGYGYGYDCSEIIGGGSGPKSSSSSSSADDDGDDEDTTEDEDTTDDTTDDTADDSTEDGATDDSSDDGDDDAGEYEGDPEVVDAYEFGKKHGLTTKDLKEARLYDFLNRGELAKMMSAYIKNVDGKEPVDNPVCDITTYGDYDSFDDELKMYIKMACDFGIMGWKNDKSGLIENFRPSAPVTRAELAAVLSRYLYGDEHAGPDMNAHLKALQEDGIMNNIDSPLSEELRGYVLIMLQRIAGGKGVDDTDEDEMVEDEMPVEDETPVDEMIVEETP